MNHLIQESNLDKILLNFQFETSSGLTASKAFFSELPKFKTIVAKRTATIEDMKPKAHDKEIHALWATLAIKEKELLPYIGTATDLTEQVEGEVYFTNPHLKCLNMIPFVVSILIFLKVWIAPILGLLMPIMVLIVPYIMIKYIMCMPIPWDIYCGIMLEMVVGIKKGETITLKQVSQIVYFVVSFGQGMIQPILTSIQTRKTDSKLRHIGNNLIQYIEISKELYARLMTSSLITPPPLLESTDPRIAYWWFRENQLLFKSWMQQVGCMDVYWSLAKQGTWKPVSLSKDLLHLKGLADLSISEPVYSSLELNGHSLLTGPNRGGKSSSLRAVLQQVLFARVFGITSCLESATLPWYTWIHSRIRSLDTPGEYSLFEEDVRSSAKVLAMAETTPHGLVLIDELFHSTNPPDALLCATTFLTKFWPTKHTTSIISTHSFELLKDVPNHDVKLLCCPATEQDSTIHYTYKLEEGVCKVSSVREVLREAGLLVGQDA